ncbi:MAG TPA: arylsulfatase [Candidatus Paceibacterota bacterium]|nr:arylsulfatase [Verrucomicrobiota bacterium]HOX02279.1 arylsulfatase [Verrucomicrobiota bacterium]HRZ47143.1 arylsulfatase [Candidatus Paceibacterota bacterium]HRZ93305.1 arylsulfatase [Candidatus Paceibacterota bacterium]
MNPILILLCGLLSALAHLAAVQAASPPSRPNIIVILVDDMGWSDLGCYGSEIPTPNLDALASNGLRFTQFYNTARCCPTRASLLTGLYPHQAGVGHMTSPHKDAQGNVLPGYTGRLNDQCVTMGEVMGSAGYFTIMSGKWHVGQNLGVVPWERGFDRSLNAAAGGFYFHDSARTELFLNGQPVGRGGASGVPAEWYSTDLWTEYGLKFIDEARAARKPFFLYLAHNAPHFPLQAPPETIARFRGQYTMGWDKLREARHARQKELGVVDPSWPLAPRPEGVKAWDELGDAEKDRFDQIMAIYAACVHRMDRAIGTLVDGLRQRGALDNTLILFMSDNGGNAESGPNGRLEGPDPGGASSTVFCGESWAWLQNTPFRLYKHFNHEGGIATPLIAHWPAGIRSPRGGAAAGTGSGRLIHEPGHLVDIMATVVDVGGATYPKEFNGHAIRPMEGRSLAPFFSSVPSTEVRPLYWEHEGNGGIRLGDWKLVRRGALGPWELYNLRADRTEQANLAATRSEIARDLAAQWDAWAKRAYALPGPWKAAAKTKPASRRARFDLGPEADLARADSPDCSNRGFTATVRIAAPGREGVLVAQGGEAHGWAMFFQNGTFHFALNRSGSLEQIRSDDPAFASAKTITAALGADATLALAADGREILRKKMAGLLSTLPVDGLQVGRDLAGTVGDYAAPFPFAGKISGVLIELDPRR